MTKLITFVDPREIDGTPYDVSDKSIRQVASLVTEARSFLQKSDTMLLNTELQRELDFGNDDTLPHVARQWKDRNHSQAALIDRIVNDLAGLERTLKALHAASTYDPKHPPTLAEESS